jgi:hypothetical protein
MGIRQEGLVGNYGKTEEMQSKGGINYLVPDYCLVER